jgi:hypothetical protein
VRLVHKTHARDTSTFRQLSKCRNDGYLLAALSSFSRFGGVKDGDYYQLLVSVAEKNALVRQELRICRLLGAFEAYIEDIGFLIVINPCFPLRQANKMRDCPRDIIDRSSYCRRGSLRRESANRSSIQLFCGIRKDVDC